MRLVYVVAALVLVGTSAVAGSYGDEMARLRTQLPVAGTLLNDPGAVSIYGANQTHETIADDAVPGGMAWRIKVSAPGEGYSAGTIGAVGGAVHKGDVLFLAFYARAVESSDESQSGILSAVNLQGKGAPWTVAVGTGALAPLGQWRLFYASAVAPEDLPAGSAIVTAHVGIRRQTIDLGPVFVLDLGPGVALAQLPVSRITYPGREADAPWRAAAAARIRAIRMGDFSVRVTNASGKPVPGAAVHIAMTRHAFRFGSFVGHNLANASGPDADKLRQSFRNSFNFATSPIYWGDWGWYRPEWRANYIASMAWLQQNGYDFRAHTVIYPREDITPKHIKALAGDPAAARAAILDHVRDVVPIAAHYGAYAMDVVNEPRDGHYIPDIAGPDIFADAFRTAHQLAPKAELFVNEYGIISGGGHNEKNLAFYHAWIEDMLAKGVPVSGIGLQGHFGADLTDPARIIAVMDEFARYKLPLEITEFTVDTPDEEAQADFTRDALTAVFSHPAADAFVLWGWWEGNEHHDNAALLRRDWSEKPNYKVWKKLIYHDWWTDETRTAAADGTTSLRAFYGDYTITVTAGGRTATVKTAFRPGLAPVSVVVH